MADEVTITWNGAQLLDKLKSFQEDIAIKTVRTSLRRIAVYLQRLTASNAPRRTGKLAANIAVKTAFIFSRGIVKAKVGVNTRGKAGDAQNAFYWRFVERGHRTRGGRRQVAAQPFAADAFISAQSVIADMFFSDLQRSIAARESKGFG